MGLGKTMQLLAFLLRRKDGEPGDCRPALLVAPTSVVGNWEREAERFAPSLKLRRHYGPDRARRAAELPGEPGALVLTTYGLLRRDAPLLAGVDWSVVALDEAQNIKNSASETARAARALRASHRFALTGTPVENRLAELWSILEFANPGLLGPLAAFLRRVKSDPAIIQDLPPKNEVRTVCTLTREQATLYKAVVDEELRRIEQAQGMERKGRVLSLLLYTKQVCNHPAHYLRETGPLPRRSGKLARVTEMLEEALAEGDKALLFTQFREMGDLLKPVVHGALLKQLGAPPSWTGAASPADVLSPLVQAAARTARKLAMAEAAPASSPASPPASPPARIGAAAKGRKAERSGRKPSGKPRQG